MFLKNKLLFFLLTLNFYISNCKAEQLASKNPKIEYKNFDIQKGFEVYSASSMEFDDLGWLWVSGSNLQLAKGKIYERTGIIQRYDGNRFYTVEIPNFPETPNLISLVKRLDGQFYVIFHFFNKNLLFLINPKTLVFKEIKLPFSKEYQNIFLFPYKDYFLTYAREKTEIQLFRLDNNLKFTLYPFKPITSKEEKDIPDFQHFIGFENHYMVSDTRMGTYVYNKDGSLLEKVSLSNLGLKNKEKDFLLNIDFWFKIDDLVYIYFLGIKDCFEYNPQNKKWSKTKNIKEQFPSKYDRQQFLSDTKGNLLQQNIFKDNITITINLKDNPNKTIIDTSLNSFSMIASRDYSKELFMVNKGGFYHYTFKNTVVSTFLENNSIRGMLQLNSDEVLVTTNQSGWYIVNLKTKTEKKYIATLKGEPYQLPYSNNIYEDRDYYWANNHKGIIWINKKTKKAESHIFYPIVTSVEDGDYIYSGTFYYNLMKFDKQRKKNSILTSTSNYDVQNILKINNTIYLACVEGLLAYENNQKTLYNPKKEIGNSLFICIVQHPKHGILLGNQLGELFRFNPVSKVFTLLYKDDLKASIATILFDNDDIWLNTYNGIISFNPKTKATTRYTMDDGLSFYEANRYSALKTNEGSFLVGTIKGLNYFDPKKISKKIINADFKLTSTTYFNKNTKTEVKEISPEKLTALKTITLPPESKNLQLQFSLFGLYNSNKIKYRYRLNKELWVDLFTDTEIRLSNLSAGKHILEIEAIDSANKIIGKPIMLSIFAGEFFYKSDWFYFLFFLGIVVIIFGFYLEERKKNILKEHFSNKIISTQEEERSRVAKELHDSIGQRLLVLQKTVLKNKSKEETELKMINDVINEVRNISHNLHPFQFKKLGLAKSLENMMDAFQKTSDVFYSYEIADNIDVYISKEKGLFIFRMLQECIANVEKHAKATACNLTITNEAKIIRFVLKDNGSGFIVNNAMNSNESLGLKSLQERAQFINAILNIQSNPKTGTVITIKIAK
ncbi:sensor histidine kinase [Tenacibaculum sp. IB213877]|uniref:sensor histidine kinase n=1 Tax=Tenacibaculum sp. IB213877 TaxID=3097351 RepID=UPI002A5AEA46|nr:sensor histidine kinase [Tenacibaculum sp. IB213877]MDY0781032.1 sensor histidine kinase [Tenacibaculum sp. IB213877]